MVNNNNQTAYNSIFDILHNYNLNTVKNKKTENDQENKGIDWLVKNFMLNPSYVEKSSFLFSDFSVFFKSDKESEAKQFHYILTKLNVNSTHFKYRNSVLICDFLSQQEKFLKAPDSRHIQKLIEEFELINLQNFENKINPFTIEWMAKNFNLDYAAVQKVEFNSLIEDFSFVFKAGKKLEATQFKQALAEIGCSTYVKSDTDTVVIVSRADEDKIRDSTSSDQILLRQKKREIPFTIDWLAKNFMFEPSDVKEIKWNLSRFEIFFKAEKKLEAKRLYYVLATKLKILSSHYKDDNSISISNCLSHKEKILKAADTNQIQEWIEEFKIINLKKSENKINPFTIEWMAKHFNFDPAAIQKIEFDSVLKKFNFHFKAGKEFTAKLFYNRLHSLNCYVEMNKSGANNPGNSFSVEIKDIVCVTKTKYSKIKIIESVENNNNLVSTSVKYEIEITDNLRKGIYLIQKFIRILLVSQNMVKNSFTVSRSYFLSDAEISLAESNVSDCEAAIKQFMEEIRELLPLLKKIVFDPDYAEDYTKLQNYFSTEENLFSRLLNFINNGASYEALASGC